MHRDQTARVYCRAVGTFVLRAFEDQLTSLLDQPTTQRNRFAGVNGDARDAMSQPDSLHDARVIAHGRAEFLEASRQTLDLEPLERALHRAFGLEEQLVDGHRRRQRLMSRGEV